MEEQQKTRRISFWPGESDVSKPTWPTLAKLIGVLGVEWLDVRVQ
jgi:hypothetical protein